MPRECSGVPTSPLPFREATRPRPPCTTFHSCLKLPSCKAPPPPSSPSANEDCHNNPSSDQKLGHLLSLLLSVDGDPHDMDREMDEEARENQRTAPRRTRGQGAKGGRGRSRDWSPSVDSLPSMGSFRGLLRRGACARATAARRAYREREATAAKLNEQEGQRPLSDAQHRPSGSEQRQIIGDASLMANSGSSGVPSGTENLQEREATANERQATQERLSDFSLTNDSLSFISRKMKYKYIMQGPEQSKSCGKDPRPKFKTNATEGSNKSTSFTRCRTKMQGKEEQKNYGVDLKSNDKSNAAKESNQALSTTPESDLFRRYLENKAKTRIGVANISTQENMGENTSLMQGREESRISRIDPQSNDRSNGVKGFSHALITVPRSDVFHRYLEIKAGTRIDIVKPSAQESIDGLASTPFPVPCLPDLDPPAKNDCQVGRLLVEWGDNSTTTT